MDGPIESVLCQRILRPRPVIAVVRHGGGRDVQSLVGLNAEHKTGNQFGTVIIFKLLLSRASLAMRMDGQTDRMTI